MRVSGKEAEHQAKAQQMLANGKEVAQKFMKEQVQKAINWLKDEKNREKVIQYGISIARLAHDKKSSEK